MSEHLSYGRLTYKDLEQILGLPDGVEIIGVDCGAFVHERGALHVLMKHPSFPKTPEGGQIPRISWPEVEKCKDSPENTLSTQ